MKKIRCFIAGAKDQERQREILTSIFGNKQTKWNVMFETKSFLDFDGTLSSDGQQKDYNSYILQKANLVVFVFDHNVGEKTIEEFILAYKGLLSRNHPDIIVFYNARVVKDSNLQVMNIMMNQLKQYYIEYETDEDLKHLFSEEIDKYIKRYTEKSLLKWLIHDFFWSNRYIQAKNAVIVVLGVLLCCSIGYMSLQKHSSGKEEPELITKILENESVYDGSVIIGSRTIRTTNNIVRVEELVDGVYRYLSWNVVRGEKGKKEPSLVISGGEYKNRYYHFKKGTYQYCVPALKGNPLIIMEGNRMLGSEVVMDFNYQGVLEQNNSSMKD